MRRCLAGVAAAVALAATACGVGGRDVQAVAPEDVPVALRPRSTTSVAPPTRPDSAPTVNLFWVQDGRLVPETVTFQSPPSPQRLLTILATAPDRGDGVPGVRTALPTGTALRVAEVDGQVVTVAVPESFLTTSGPDQALAVGQLVATLDSLPGVDGVQLRRDGRVVEAPTADGTLVRRTLRIGDYAGLIGPG